METKSSSITSETWVPELQFSIPPQATVKKKQKQKQNNPVVFVFISIKVLHG